VTYTVAPAMPNSRAMPLPAPQVASATSATFPASFLLVEFSAAVGDTMSKLYSHIVVLVRNATTIMNKFLRALIAGWGARKMGYLFG